jgi:hypothetical protein
MEFGLDRLHGEIGPLDEANLDAGAAAGTPGPGPGAQPAQGRVGVGDIGLQDDSGVEVGELRRVENLREGAHRQFEVAELLHVEVDERPRRRRLRGAVQVGEPRLDPGQRLVLGEDVEVRTDGRDLDRDVGDVGAANPVDDVPAACVGLVVAQDRLSEHVHVEVESVL